MKAIVVEKYGAPDVLKLMEVEKPSPKDNEILVKVHAANVNVGDCRIRAFRVPPIFWLPARLSLGFTKPRDSILGMDLSGEVEAVGKDVTRFKPGDQVFGSTFKLGYGAYAQYKCMPADGIVALKPANLSYEEAAAIPLGADTALHFLKLAHIQNGQKVLINGASGSVGTYAVQLAKYYGAEVTAVCSAANAELVKSLGADYVIDYNQEDFTQNGKVYDIVFDAVATTTFTQCKDSVKDGGYYLHTVMPEAALTAGWYLRTTGKHLIANEVVERTEDLEFLADLAAAGTLRPVMDRCYPMEEIAAAHSYVDTGRKKGNVVVTITH